ncbi:hypothetical protein DZF91_36195, partial [Actinomadura logoneensis]
LGVPVGAAEGVGAAVGPALAVVGAGEAPRWEPAVSARCVWRGRWSWNASPRTSAQRTTIPAILWRSGTGLPSVETYAGMDK